MPCLTFFKSIKLHLELLYNSFTFFYNFFFLFNLALVLYLILFRLTFLCLNFITKVNNRILLLSMGLSHSFSNIFKLLSMLSTGFVPLLSILLFFLKVFALNLFYLIDFICKFLFFFFNIKAILLKLALSFSLKCKVSITNFIIFQHTLLVRTFNFLISILVLLNKFCVLFSDLMQFFRLLYEIEMGFLKNILCKSNSFH